MPKEQPEESQEETRFRLHYTELQVPQCWTVPQMVVARLY